MADNETTPAAPAEQQVTPPVEESNLPEGHAPEGEEQSGEQSENQSKEGQPSGEAGDQSEQEQKDKPSRVERRIHTLINKVKENGQGQTQTPTQMQRPQPLISEEEKQNGEVDPQALEQRIQSTIDRRVQEALEIREANRLYESAVREHQADLEGVKDLDPDLEDEAAAQYEALNYRINPFTGKSQFIPAVKFSEIVAKIEAIADKRAAKKAEAIAEGNERFIRGVSSSQAVPTSGSVTSSATVKPETTDFSQFEKAYSAK